MANTRKRASAKHAKPSGVTRLEIAGYKSISAPQSLEIRPLTILAGANSSGKSSVMQPLLLLKQTLAEASDPGAILLDGPNVKFTSAKQMLCKCRTDVCRNGFAVGIEVDSDRKVTTRYVMADGGFSIESMDYQASGNPKIVLKERMSHQEILPQLPGSFEHFPLRFAPGAKWKVTRNRCFLELVLNARRLGTLRLGLIPPEKISLVVEGVIHLPGLRGNPEPTYPVRAVGRYFPGLFQDYVASVIDKWQARKDGALSALKSDLERLGLTWTVQARHVSDTRVELRVGRLPRAARGGAKDVVSIADVGFGVSQALPVVVAVHAARPGQLVYIEQPEIHLHPRAQFAMAEILADAAKRGVRVVAETHSDLLLLAIQSLVAEGKLSPELVQLHWFKRGLDGCTEIKSAQLDDSGAFGAEWPEDFAATRLEIENRYLDAVEARHWKPKHG
jgi:predicted ATPase